MLKQIKMIILMEREIRVGIRWEWGGEGGGRYASYKYRIWEIHPLQKPRELRIMYGGYLSRASFTKLDLLLIGD